MSQADEALLLTLVAKGDRRSFDALYNIYYSQVARTVYYYVEDTEACREVISDVFVALWNSRKKLPDVERLDAYLFRMTRNACVQRLAMRRRERHDRLSELPPVLELDSTARADDGVLSEELGRTIGRIVGSLPEKCRIIFMLSREDGIDNKEIAARLGISESTVRVQLKIAVDRIVQGLRKIYPDISLPVIAMALFA